MGNLYNPYNNKNIRFLLNYICSVGKTEQYKPYSRNKMIGRLTGGWLGLTSDDVVESICGQLKKNPHDRKEQQPCALFFEDSDNKAMVPTMSGNISGMTSAAERIWLKSVLSDPRSELFMSPKERDTLLNNLDEEILDAKYYDDRVINRRVPEKYDGEYVNVFRQIVKFVKKAASLEIKLKDNDSTFFFPYAIDYSEAEDRFILIGYDFAQKDVALRDISSIVYINPAPTDIASGSAAEDIFLSSLETHKSKVPILLEVMGPAANNPNMANDRISHLLSVYESECFEENQKLYIRIFFYDFQTDEIIRIILSLGKYVKVISPTTIQNIIIKNLKEVVTRK